MDSGIVHLKRKIYQKCNKNKEKNQISHRFVITLQSLVVCRVLICVHNALLFAFTKKNKKEQ